MTEFDIQLALFQHFQPFNGRIVVPNISTGYGEADFLSMTKAGYVTEFEIKVSRSDFAADKNKRGKHHAYKTVFNNKPFTWWDGIKRPKNGIPNYFVYVVPDYFNIDTLKVPEYAGLWIMDSRDISHYSHGFKCKRIPPKIHKEKHKLFWLNKIARSYNAKYYYHYFRDKKA